MCSSGSQQVSNLFFWSNSLPHWNSRCPILSLFQHASFTSYVIHGVSCIWLNEYLALRAPPLVKKKCNYALYLIHWEDIHQPRATGHTMSEKVGVSNLLVFIKVREDMREHLFGTRVQMKNSRWGVQPFTVPLHWEDIHQPPVTGVRFWFQGRSSSYTAWWRK